MGMGDTDMYKYTYIYMYIYMCVLWCRVMSCVARRCWCRVLVLLSPFRRVVVLV